MLSRLQSITYTLFLFLTPLLVTSFSKELFEFPKTNFLYLMTGILLLLWAFQFKFEFRLFKNKFARLFLWAVLLILAANFISLIFSIDHYTSLFGYYTRFNGGFLSILCLAIWILFFINKNLEKDDVEKILLVIFVSGLIIAVYAILQKFGVDKDFWKVDATKRVFSTLGQPNWLAAFLIPIFFLALYFAHRLKIHPVLKFLPVLLVYFAILFTYSISGIFALLISVLVYGILNVKQVKGLFKKYWIAFGIIFILSLALAIPLRDRISEQVKNLNGIIGLIETNNSQNLKPNYGDTGKIRLILWDGTINLILSSPKQFLFGSGSETFVYAFPKFRPDSINATSEAGFVHNKPHNWYLEIFANLGFLGFSAYLFFIGLVICIFSKSKKSFLSKILFCGWISILITNFFGWPTVSLSILFFLIPVFMNYEIFAHTQSKTSEINWPKLFTFFLVGNLLVFTALILATADYKFKARDYESAHRLNPLEPRYELFQLIQKREIEEDIIRSFYYKNRHNPYVVKTLMNYLNSVAVDSEIRKEIILDARENSPSDKLFRN